MSAKMVSWALALLLLVTVGCIGWAVSYGRLAWITQAKQILLVQRETRSVNIRCDVFTYQTLGQKNKMEIVLGEAIGLEQYVGGGELRHTGLDRYGHPFTFATQAWGEISPNGRLGANWVSQQCFLSTIGAND